MNSRFGRQLAFLLEIDKVKNILRRTRLYDRSRYENDAEHAWHMAVMVLVLAEYANEPGIDIGKVLKMALIHDIVEIDAGDQYLYSGNRESQQVAEKMAAERIFGLLPEDQRNEFTGLWEEFEARETPEARFAKAIDRLGPLLQEHHDNGHAWRMHGVKAEQVMAVNSIIGEGSRELWGYAKGLIEEAVARGILE